MKKKARTFDEWRLDQLKDPKSSRMYIEIALEEYEEDQDKEALFVALRNVTEAQGGISQLADRTGLNRQNLYNALSRNGNPRFDTLEAILNALGFRISFSPLKRPRKQQPSPTL